MTVETITEKLEERKLALIEAILGLEGGEDLSSLEQAVLEVKEAVRRLELRIDERACPRAPTCALDS